MDHAIALPLAVFTLMLVSMGVFLLSRRFHVPYTVLLVFVGLVLVPLTQTSIFSYITTFHLTPEMLFFIFLPVLIFEAAYNMSIPQVMRQLRAITLLAVGGLLIAVFATAVFATAALHVIGVEVPFIALVLFGAIIAATDPVAVLALFKDYGAPRRLALLFEGESLFNDATAMALFVLVLEVIRNGTFIAHHDIPAAAGLFMMMIVGGAVFGLMMGAIFSKALQYTDRAHVHITLTMLVAHFTFLLTEMISRSENGIHLSSIIATVVAAMVVGNYGRYKMTPRTEEYLQQFWDYFAFVTNAIVFLLMGLIFADIDVALRELAIPLAVIIIVVIVVRALSVYGVLLPYNMFVSSSQRIPLTWQHLLSWGSLRGALAITMALMIPQDLHVPGWTLQTSPRDFLLALTIGCIYFTLFIKATTIPLLMRRLRITQRQPLEEVEYWEGRANLYATALSQLQQLHAREHIEQCAYDTLHQRLRAHYDRARTKLHAFIASDSAIVRRMLKLYAIGVEKRTLQNLYTYGEITERAYKKVLGKLAVQRAYVESGEDEHRSFEQIFVRDMIEGIINIVRRMMFLRPHTKTPRDKFLYYRALMILAQEVVAQLRALQKRSGVHDNDASLRDVMETYMRFARQSERKMRSVLAEHPTLAEEHEELLCREVLRIEEDVLDDLVRTEMITPKLSSVLRREIRTEVL